MTQEQREIVECLRIVGETKDKPLTIDNGCVRLLMAIIDAQEAELQSARDTIARYEAMLREVIDEEGDNIVRFEDGHISASGGAWVSSWWIDYDNSREIEPYSTALDAYDALKEAAG